MRCFQDIIIAYFQGNFFKELLQQAENETLIQIELINNNYYQKKKNANPQFTATKTLMLYTFRRIT